jgi:hypothetical protein
MLFIWKVIDSSHDWHASVSEILGTHQLSFRHVTTSARHSCRMSLHLRQLLPNNRLTNKRLPKHNPLVRPLQTLFNHSAHTSNNSTRHGPSFVVEIRHDDDETLVFFAEEVVHRDFDIVELDECCGCGC